MRPKTISFEESCARIKAAQAAARRAHQQELRNLFHTKLEERIIKEAEAKGLKDSSAKLRHLERQLRHKDEEIAVLRDLLKKTYQVMPIDSK